MGPSVNSEKVTAPRAIDSGDRITLGTVNLWLEGGEQRVGHFNDLTGSRSHVSTTASAPSPPTTPQRRT